MWAVLLVHNTLMILSSFCFRLSYIKNILDFLWPQSAYTSHCHMDQSKALHKSSSEQNRRTVGTEISSLFRTALGCCLTGIDTLSPLSQIGGCFFGARTNGLSPPRSDYALSYSPKLSPRFRTGLKSKLKDDGSMVLRAIYRLPLALIIHSIASIIPIFEMVIQQ